MKLVTPDDPILREVMPHYDGDPKALKKTAAEMHELFKRDGVGLAAPQVGLRLRMFVMNPRAQRHFRDAYVCINPEILLMSEISATGMEGCLTWPGKRVPIDRPVSIAVAWTNLAGKRIAGELFSFHARVFMHEFDHLEGRTIFNAAPSVDVQPEPMINA